MDCTKMVIIIRKDLLLTKGKAISQGCHAALKSFLLAKITSPKITKFWEMSGSAKIVLSVSGEQNIIGLANKASQYNIPHYLVKDAGLTEVPQGTITALAIGPWTTKEIDHITGHLKLY